MSEEANGTAALAAEPVFKKLGPSGELQGKLVFARAKALRVGDSIQGILEGTVLNEMTEKDDYKIRITKASLIGTMAKGSEDIVETSLEADDLVIINSAGNLKYRMQDVAVGTLVRIEYAGMNTLTSGKFKNKPVHNFDIFVA